MNMVVKGKARVKPKGKEADRRKSRQRLLKEMEIVERKPRKVKIPFSWLYGIAFVIAVTIIIPNIFTSSTFQGNYMDIKVDSPPDTPITFQEPEPEPRSIIEEEEITDPLSLMIYMFENNVFFWVLAGIPLLIITNKLFFGWRRW